MKSELSSMLGSKKENKESEVKYEEKSEEIKDVIDFFGEDIVEIRKEGE